METDQLYLYTKTKDLERINNITETIKDVTSRKLKELYGENIDLKVKSRYEYELNTIIKNGFENIYMISYKITNKAREDRQAVLLKCAASSSFIAYLLGITCIDPIKYNIPFEIFSSIEGDKTPYFDFVFNSNYAESIYKYVKEILENNNITYYNEIEEYNYKIFQIIISKSEDLDQLKKLEEITKIKHNQIDITDTKILKVFNENNLKGIFQFDNKKARNIINKVKPKSIEDLIKISALLNGRNIWEDNVEELIEEHSINEIACSRDEIYIYLLEKGLDRKTAFYIMKFVRQGRATKPNHINEWKKYVEIMQIYNIPQWYILSLQKIKYMPSKALCTNYVVLSLWLAWYKTNYKKEFEIL